MDAHAPRHDCFFFSSRRRHTRFDCDWSSDVCSSDLSAIEESSASVGTLLPIFLLISSSAPRCARRSLSSENRRALLSAFAAWRASERSEERRVGKECRSRWWPYHLKKKDNKYSGYCS